MKIYTKTGDSGETGLFGGSRVSKAHPRVDAYGTVDELNAVIGLVRSAAPPLDIDTLLESIQSELFDVGAELATQPEKIDRVSVPLIGEAAIARLEVAIDASESELEPLTSFVLPGGVILACHLHHARTVCRRTERCVVALAEKEAVRNEVVRYLNRLSDLLFSWARLANHRAGRLDVSWRGRNRVADALDPRGSG
jgi:cob(I)alamin adenosyltransferase